ncbi:BQ5605_C010g06006 [Microbotryum silenes-dioicae]|uniref:BQ5605_C010g06006 protein n=1 Tax=Microbotryum silenes-dioicae TaxID=796604 RepID=A0A2X0NU76_9BASI|nr:BQ5605_C010g06006 [Microbotryum silenes-dioicae]
MFTSFRQGADAVEQWDDTPSYVPGRFHAHVLPSPTTSHGFPSGPLASTSTSGSPLSRARSPPPSLSPIAQRSKLPNSIRAEPDHSTRKGRLIAALAPRPPARFASPPPPPSSIPPKRFASISRAPHSSSALESDPLLPSTSTTTARSSARRPDLPSSEISDPSFLGRPRPGAKVLSLFGTSPSRGRLFDSSTPEHDETSWLLLRPSQRRVEAWLEYWYKRWAVLVLFPSLIVWIWCAMPFPVSDPYKETPPWNLPWPEQPPTSNGSATIHKRFVWTFGRWMGRSAGQSVGVGGMIKARREERASVLLHFVEQAGIHKQVATEEGVRVEGRSAGWKNPSLSDRDSPTIPVESPGGDPTEELPVDANFYFFLFVYYGIYLAVALIFVTKLFDLYRLNWWPSSLGGSFSYLFFWSLSLLIGFLLHHWNLDGLGRRSRQGSDRPPSDRDSWDWERKTTWVALAFFCMTLPALACFIKLRADRRQTWRRSLTVAQKTFLERQLIPRMPRSYRRFLWFLTTLTISLFALIIGQGFATIYLSTLPHSNIDGLVYVWTWIVTVQILNATSNFILQRKVRSRALVFVFRYYYYLVYGVFYRSLFARLRSPNQAVYIQLLSSSFVILWYPLSMCRPFHSLLKFVTGLTQEYEEYAEDVGTMLYLRNLSENVTMVAFLGWLTILHFGPNKQIYPYFSFESTDDSYTYELTATASLIIWATELGCTCLQSSFVARQVIWIIYGLDVTNLGLDAFRELPELVVACFWTSVHVLMDMLLFLVKLNFR